MRRDEFSRAVRERVAARVGSRCSNPDCQKITSGPATDPSRAVNIGVAAHITAAAPGGPRFDPSLTPDRRASADNAIWLCQSCAALIDRDDTKFSVHLLLEWRQRAEDAAAKALSSGSRYRPIAAREVRQELSLAEVAAVRALEREFGCLIETEVHIPAGQGWLRLQGAAVCGEDLVAIDIHENHGRGIAYFQIEHLIELCRTLKFERFQKCMLFVAVVPDGPVDADGPVLQRLEQMAGASDLEIYIRMYRLNQLRVEFSL